MDIQIQITQSQNSQVRWAVHHYLCANRLSIWAEFLKLSSLQQRQYQKLALKLRYICMKLILCWFWAKYSLTLLNITNGLYVIVHVSFRSSFLLYTRTNCCIYRSRKLDDEDLWQIGRALKSLKHVRIMLIDLRM